jgi:hypothetical protein
MGSQSRFQTAVLLALAATAAGCQMEKSANPLSPVIAGPIPGVVITQPNLLEPGQGWQIRMRDQPIKLMIQNGDTSGVRPITYRFQVASDPGFATIVFEKTGVPPGNVTTTLQLPSNLPTGRSYWWRARAEDGANSSEYSKVVSFTAVTPVELGPPNPLSPIGPTATLAPEFVIREGVKSGPAERIVYTVQVANDSNFGSIAALWVVDETQPVTTVAKNYTFLDNRTYYWRVQAKDAGDSLAVSTWSGSQTFTTPKPAAPPPSPGSGGNGNWQSCGDTEGEALVTCVRNAVYRQSTLENAFDVTKRVAWLLRGRGYGLLIKDSGENIIPWQGHWFSISRVCHPGGYPVKVLSDAGPGGANGAAWSPDPADNICAQPGRFWPALNPDLP